MTNYIVCPDCGYKLFKAGDGSNVEIYCPKCKAKLQIEIKNGKFVGLFIFENFYKKSYHNAAAHISGGLSICK